MKHGAITIIVLMYFVASVFYMLSCPDAVKNKQHDAYVWLWVFYYLVQYGTFFLLSLALSKANFGVKSTFNSVDLFSLFFSGFTFALSLYFLVY